MEQQQIVLHNAVDQNKAIVVHPRAEVCSLWCQSYSATPPLVVCQVSARADTGSPVTAAVVHAAPACRHRGPVMHSHSTSTGLAACARPVCTAQWSLQVLEQEEEEAKPETPKKEIVVSGGLVGFGVAQDLLHLDFSPEEVAPPEYRAVAYNATVPQRLRSGGSGILLHTPSLRH